MQNFISSSDLFCWNIVLNGNSAKSMTTDNDGNLKIRLPVTAEEHQQVQRKEKPRTILLSALLDEHMGDFYHMIDARDIWNAIKARFEEGLDKGYDKMQKILTQMNTLKIKPEPEDVNIKFLRGLPPSWSGIALILKTKGGLEYILFDDLYNKLKFLEIDTKGYSSSSSTLSNAAFVTTAGSSQGNLSYQEGNGGYTTTLSVSPGSLSSKGSSKSKCSVVDDVIYSFFANHEIDQHLDKQTEEGNIEPRSLENFGMVAGIEIASDADSEGEMVSADNAIPAGVSISAGEVAAAVVSPQSETEFALMGLSTEAVPPPLTGNYMPPSNIPDIDESHMVYGKKATNSSKIKTNDDSISHSHDFVLFYFSDRVSTPATESRHTIVIDCDRQEDFPSVCTGSTETDVKSSKTFYLNLIKDCDLHEQRLAKRNAEGKVSAGQPNPVSAGEATLACNSIPLSVSAGDGILGNIEPRSLENFGMVAGIKIASDADSEGEMVSADNVIPAGVSVSTGEVTAAVAAQEKQDLMSKLDNEIANQAKWNNSGKNLYKLIDSSMSVRTKRGLGLNKYIGEGELGIDDSKFSIFHTNSDELEGQSIYNRFALVDHMKAVPPPLTGNYMPPLNIPDIDESHMVYGKKATNLSKIKTNDDNISHSHDFFLFYFSDRSSKPYTNDFQTCDSSVECSRPNHSDHDFNDSISRVSAPVNESRHTIVIDCDRQEDFPSVCTSSTETDVKSSKTLCNKFGSFNKEIHFRKNKFVASKSCDVCGSYLHLIKDCDLHEQRLAKRNDEGNVSAGQPNPVSAGEATLACNSIPLSVSTGDGIIGPRPLNIQPKSTYFHSFTYNNQQIIFLITYNSLYSLYMTGGLNGKTAIKPQQVGLGQNM
nr:xylulose kinase-1 [Tanacetum cinerariifolium]